MTYEGHHLRCRACRQWLAGPLVEEPELARVRLGDGSVAFPAPPLSLARQAFCVVDDELLAYAGWCHAWVTDDGLRCGTLGLHWEPAWTSRELARSRAVLETRQYGCCGPSGDIACSCGQVLGMIHGDCSDLGLLRLARSHVELSELSDDEWTIYPVFGEDDGVIREVGRFSRGRREGEWSTYRGDQLVALTVYARGDVVSRLV